VSLRLITPPLGPGIIVAAAHLRSKLQADDFDQHIASADFNSQILAAEQEVGHKRTLVIGDLNMNPFDPGMVAANGLHAVMDKTTAYKERRVVQGERYEFFYNPMWSRMGDESRGPPGTYYLDRSGRAINHFWSTFDQVLLRPDLLKFYNYDRLYVLDQINSVNLLKDGVIKRELSDHLPIVIDLATESEVL
jgi:endonuclease/exonuclease/phosphatase family metal-dependent hydrolase